MSKLTLALIADIHYGPDRGTKKSSLAVPLLRRFGAFVSDLKPDATIELGDRTSQSDEDEVTVMKEIAAVLHDKIPGRLYHLLGNHDLDGLTQEDNERILGKPLASTSLDINGIHIVLWNTKPELDRVTGFDLPPEELKWLKEDLAKTELPTIIFSHVPLDNGSMKGNYYLEKTYPTHAGYPEKQGEALRDVIERSGKVILCVNGHAHWNAYHCIDGVHYVTIPSLVESFTTSPFANEAWARLTVDDAIEIEVYGRTPMLYRLPIKKPHAHWINVDKDYAPKA